MLEENRRWRQCLVADGSFPKGEANSDWKRNLRIAGPFGDARGRFETLFSNKLADIRGRLLDIPLSPTPASIGKPSQG